MLCNYPLLFEKNIHTLVWGTESWEVSAVPSSPCIVANGPLKGRDIISVIDEFGPEILGDTVYEEFDGKLPLLVKFIDAKKDLSIQVHPNDTLAMERHQCFGKTEMWYIIAAEPGASILAGLKEELTPEDYKRRVADGTIVDALARHEVHPGDVFYIPAGRVHTIGAGILLADIQQTSDITYRIYDYNRPGLDGKPRQLHTELAAEALDYRVYDNYRTLWQNQGSVSNCLTTPFFTVNHISATQPLRLNRNERNSFVILSALKGNCQLM
jgi:mannose-6-phosphate isomerase